MYKKILHKLAIWGIIFAMPIVMVGMSPTEVNYDNFDFELTWTTSYELVRNFIYKIDEIDPEYIAVNDIETRPDIQETLARDCDFVSYLDKLDFINYEIYYGGDLVYKKGQVKEDSSETLTDTIYFEKNYVESEKGVMNFDGMNTPFYRETYDEVANVDMVCFNSPNSYHVNLSIDIKEAAIYSNNTHSSLFYSHINDELLIKNGSNACISLAILVLVLFFIPMSWYQESALFKWFSNIKLLFACIIFGIVGFGGFFGLYLTLSFASSMTLLNFIKQAGDYNIIYLIYYLIWFVVIITGTLLVYYIKYLFSKPFGQLIKENTVIGTLYYKGKELLIHFSDIEFKDPIYLLIICLCLVNLGLLLFVSIERYATFPYFLLGFVILIEFICVFIFFNRTKNDYDELLHMSKEIGKGNFDYQPELKQKAFKELGDNLNQIKDGFEEAVQEETKSQHMKTELISNVSHDLKTPLTGIKNYIEILNDEELTKEERQQYLETLNNYADRLKVLIDDLFEVSKANSGNIKLNLAEIDLVTLLEQTLEDNHDALEEAQLEVVYNKNVDKAVLNLDGDKTNRVLTNLIVNASKYSLPNTRLYIDLKDNDSTTVISFKNISKAMMNFSKEEITERFVRGDKSRTDGGSGLGLAIVKSFVEAQGGTFDIDIDGDLFKAVIIFNK